MSDPPNGRRGPIGLLTDVFQRYPRRTILILALLMIGPVVIGIAWVNWWVVRGRHAFAKRRQSKPR